MCFEGSGLLGRPRLSTTRRSRGRCLGRTGEQCAKDAKARSPTGALRTTSALRKARRRSSGNVFGTGAGKRKMQALLRTSRGKNSDKSPRGTSLAKKPRLSRLRAPASLAKSSACLWVQAQVQEWFHKKVLAELILHYKGLQRQSVPIACQSKGFEGNLAMPRQTRQLAHCHLFAVQLFGNYQPEGSGRFGVCHALGSQASAGPDRSAAAPGSAPSAAAPSEAPADSCAQGTDARGSSALGLGGGSPRGSLG